MFSDTNISPPPAPPARAARTPRGALLCGIISCLGLCADRYIIVGGLLFTLVLGDRGWSQSGSVAASSTLLLIKLLKPLWLAIAIMGFILARGEWLRGHSFFTLLGALLSMLTLALALSGWTHMYFF